MNAETIDLKKNIELNGAELINFVNLTDDEKEMVRIGETMIISEI